MKKLVLGMSATALIATAAFANDQTPGNSRMAAADNTSAMFQKLDSDADGRVSAIEAANDSKVAAAFTAADADRDGYLSKAEFAQLGQPSNTDTAPPRQ
jgi:Ca2+-binding EF-hand superfamily protein